MPAVSSQLNDFVIRDTSERRPSPARAAGAGFWSRLLKTIQEARMREAERQVAMFIEQKGGRITDTLEREIERHFI